MAIIDCPTRTSVNAGERSGDERDAAVRARRPAPWGAMSTGVDRVRRGALAMAACALLAPIAASAQDPRGATVQRVAREWLAFADRLDADATWKAAGERFQQAITVRRWAEGLAQEREPRGAVVQRTVTATSFPSSPRGLPPGGNYALVQFRTSFANQVSAEEHVTLEVGADHVWRVIGYLIR